MSVSLFVDRGIAPAHMKTESLDSVVHHDLHYLFDGTNLIPTDRPARDLEAPWAITAKPLKLKIEADWDETVREMGENNALGGYGRLSLPLSELAVPTVVATAETLAYYGSTLVKKGDVVQFPGDEFPIFAMTVGDRYIPDYLMQREGLYLEYHRDQPHYHQPLEGGGYYLLAKWNKAKTKLSMTGFSIPPETAIYTGKGQIHCDAGLWGRIKMGYTEAHDFSTVLWRHGDEKVGIRFLPKSEEEAKLIA